MATIIYNKTKSHGNNNNILSGAGVDKIKIKIPSGKRFSHFSITPASGHSGVATFNVIKSPKANATGDQEIHVMWTYGPFSKCRFKLRAYTKSPSPSTTKPVVIFGDRNWYTHAIAYLKSKQPFTLRLQGPDAQKLFNVLNPMNHSLIRRGVVVNEAVTISVTIAICITIVAVSGLAVLGAVLLYSLNQGCTAKVGYDQNGNLLAGTGGNKMDFDFSNCG